jgi:hypothetical protein
MDSRLWSEILRFYLRVILWGDPVGRKATPKQRSKAAPVAQPRPLKPLTQAR